MNTKWGRGGIIGAALPVVGDAAAGVCRAHNAAAASAATPASGMPSLGSG
jgi:hypothetical protein